jgi:hypothetical protein
LIGGKSSDNSLYFLLINVKAGQSIDKVGLQLC